MTVPSDHKPSAEAGSGLNPLPPAPRAPRLDTPDRVRAELARCYRRAAAGLVDWPTACRAGYLLHLMHKMLGDAELERLAERVARLEAAKAAQP